MIVSPSLRWPARPLARAALLATLLALGIAACGGAQRPAEPDGDRVIVGERSYARLPGELFAGQISADAVGPELVQCYEAESRTGTWDITAVLLELVWDGEHVRPRLSQRSDDLSNRVATCVEQVTINWQLEPEQVDVGTLHPVELGPLGEQTE